MRGYKNFEGNPHPGDLKHLVEIGYTKNTVNANGYPEPEDVVLCRVWASATDAGNQHYRSADVMNTEAVVNFTIRWRDDIKPGMWVRFQGEKWDIPDALDVMIRWFCLLFNNQFTPDDVLDNYPVDRLMHDIVIAPWLETTLQIRGAGADHGCAGQFPYDGSGGLTPPEGDRLTLQDFISSA